MAENLNKTNSEKVDELYEDWYGPPRDPQNAFRTRFIAVEDWAREQKEARKLKDAEEKGRHFLGQQVVSLLRYVGFSGLLLLLGAAIRFYNSMQGGTP